MTRSYPHPAASTAPPHRDLDYPAYLRSPAWRTLRAQALTRDGRTCFCGRPAQQVHHLTYRRIGQERLSDLRAVCIPCHEEIHRVQEHAGLSHREATRRVAKERHGENAPPRGGMERPPLAIRLPNDPQTARLAAEAEARAAKKHKRPARARAEVSLVIEEAQQRDNT